MKKLNPKSALRWVVFCLLLGWCGWWVPASAQNNSVLSPQSSVLNGPQSAALNQPQLQGPPPQFAYSLFATPRVLSLEGRRVSRVDLEFTNGTKSNEGIFRSLIDFRPGDEVSAVKLHDTLLKLYDSGRAANAQVYVTDDPTRPSGVILTFVITRQLRIGNVLFPGFQLFPAEELRSRLAGLELGSKVSEQAVTRAVETLANLFRDRGYFQTKITPLISEPSEEGNVIVSFTILPGDPAKLADGIQLEGNLKIDKADLTGKLKSKPGGLYTFEQVQTDLAKLRQAHLEEDYLNPVISSPFRDYDAKTNTVKVVVTINSGPKVDVKLDGYDLSRKDLKKILPVLSDGGLDEFVLEDGRQRLLDQVQRDGYFFAEVTVEPTIFEDKATVLYRVEKGQRYRVSSVKLVGTDHVAYAAAEFESKVVGPIPTSRGLTSKQAIKNDAELIERKLRNQGFLQAKVLERRLGVTPNNENLEIVFAVSEGAQTFIEELMVTGNYAFSTEKLLGALPSVNPKADYLSQDYINTDTNRLYALYEEEGYAKVRINPVIERIDDDPNRARIVFQITEGKKIFINDVIVTVRGRTSKTAIRNYIPFKRGDLLRQSQLTQTEQALYATGAFKQVVFRTEIVREDGPNRDLCDVILEVTDSNPYTISFGLGYQREDQNEGSPRGSFEVSNSNLFGKLQTASLIFRLSRREQLGQFSYQFPRPFGKPLPILLSALFSRTQEVSFDSERQTVLIQTEKRVSPATNLLFRYRFENIRVFNLDLSGNDLARNDQPVRLGRLSATFLRDTRDSALDATIGSFSIADFSFATTKLGGNEEFFRFFGQYQQFRSLPKVPSVVVATSARFGLARPLGDRDTLPISERFFAGGANTLRGLDFEQAGPRDPNTDRPIGGNALVVLNAELRFPLLWKFQGATFYDTGNVFDKVSNIQLNRFTNTIGGGLRLKTPFGPLRVDAGYLLNPPSFVAVPNKKLPGFQFHFSFGQAF
ncbi:MAG: BamA/TamA family outer membrane protein [Blastocatellia bacterium]|nr:BamA/TamA family outer membrane protein [Blastocatellia bacterium]